MTKDDIEKMALELSTNLDHRAKELESELEEKLNSIINVRSPREACELASLGGGALALREVSAELDMVLLGLYSGENDEQED